MTAYYNEHDPFAAAWLRELIKDGLIAPGDVDERDIQDVTPNDLTSYTQVHCFAGIGGWAFALRLAGWPDTRPVWTGSAPCQPFSEAGSGGGFADERHLWPAWFWLIRQCKPVTIFGEQVSSKAGLEWWDVVAADLEAAGYGCGAFDLCAAGAGAFHIRQRLYFVADAQHDGHHRAGGLTAVTNQDQSEKRILDGSFGHSLANAKFDGDRRQAKPADHKGAEGIRSSNRNGGHSGPSDVVPLGQPAGKRLERPARGIHEPGHSRDGKTNFWSNAVWLQCSDGKARPVEPSIFPLAHGVPNRVGTLRGAGNAIVPQLAAKFVRAYLEC